ncbi:hypothetical protein D3C85_1847270 [compost metagenome]
MLNFLCELLELNFELVALCLNRERAKPEGFVIFNDLQVTFQNGLGRFVKLNATSLITHC